MDAGIPVMLYNSGGADKAKELGAINYIGNEEYPAGLAAGAYFGTPWLQERDLRQHRSGRAESGGPLQGRVGWHHRRKAACRTNCRCRHLRFGDPTAVAEAIKATLLKDATINGVVTISAAMPILPPSGSIRPGVTGKVALASFDMDGAGLDRIKAGTQLFAVDQQPWLQGFLAVSMADAYVSFGTAIASAPVLTGPGIVDAANVDATIAGAAAGFR